MIDQNTIYAKRVKQNNQEFLLGIFTIQQILTFTKYTERLIVDFDEDNKPVYNPRIQRKVENSRVQKIAYFLLEDPDALFPTNIVLGIPNVVIESVEDLSTSDVKVTLDPKVFSDLNNHNDFVYLTIIDGQHRISGIERAIYMLNSDIKSMRQLEGASMTEEFKKKLAYKARQLNSLLNINLSVSFFIDPSLEFQAMVFSTINRTQKSVPQSLVTSLFGLTEADSPHKTGLELVLSLNGYEKSPFHNRIKLHGGQYGRNMSPPLTQAAMVKSIVGLISINAQEADRDRFRDRSELLKNVGPNCPFRRYYANNRDSFILDIMFSFFSAVRQNFRSGDIFFWDFYENTKPTNILHTTVGYQALMLILVDILKREIDDSRRDKIETYNLYLQKCSALKYGDTQRYPFTSISKTIFYLDMSLKIWPEAPEERQEKLSLALNR